ncbi:MAG: UDP-N-acetylglucosamine 2-epimerase, partial [Chloroflexi bacterium]|nr:UDP-N-acetylglucosamine 2-epimerase [Chloroflexota bacterium]
MQHVSDGVGCFAARVSNCAQQKGKQPRYVQWGSVTDSGGIHEETTILKVPCITLRENTERPVTVAVGSN